MWCATSSMRASGRFRTSSRDCAFLAPCCWCNLMTEGSRRAAQPIALLMRTDCGAGLRMSCTSGGNAWSTCSVSCDFTLETALAPMAVPRSEPPPGLPDDVMENVLRRPVRRERSSTRPPVIAPAYQRPCHVPPWHDVPLGVPAHSASPEAPHPTPNGRARPQYTGHGGGDSSVE